MVVILLSSPVCTHLHVAELMEEFLSEQPEGSLLGPQGQSSSQFALMELLLSLPMGTRSLSAF